ncbi:ABC transporter substrate-binding protein [Caballeronia mineralivorans PML1(12)]|uniref:ABC transporter substrate-binding protein n=1 Tax=Caballeronia mineralivorans PML1(12) TaxID=908627 RepID=A0A0J1CMS0_9BURK|nr:extracellular solute-binding protein [Caballeronia mineralivorans]KLU21829.1 ABC transporter substrate-binding protein [Caballeronia mineralivorans PML1(12)]
MSTTKNESRRRFLKTTGATGLALGAPTIWIPRAMAADTLTIADNGGALGPAMRMAFYDPFEKETGIRIVNVAHESDPVTQFKLTVDSDSHIWDLAMVTPDNVLRLTDAKNYLAPLDIGPGDAKGILPGMLTSNWFGFSVYGVVMAYRTDKYAKAVPTGWRDFWDTSKFPGRRGLYRSPSGTLENALLADGVAPKDIYPINIDRAMKSLDKIRSSVSVWWANGAQNTQLLQSGEVDMADTWNARALAAISSGAPVKIVWEGTYSVDGWSIPVGTPRLKQAQQFVRFCMRPDRQAVYASIVANGPSNSDALKLIDPKRAELLTTYPKNLERLIRRDSAWWGKNFDSANERYQEWLLQS